MWFKNRRAKCRQQLQQQTNTQMSGKATATAKNTSSSSAIKTSSKTSMGKAVTSSSSSLSSTTQNLSIATSSPNLPVTPTTSVSPPANVICKKETSSYNTSPVNKMPMQHYGSNDVRVSGKDSSPSHPLNVHSYAITPKQELYSSPKSLDYSNKMDYSEKSFGSNLSKEQLYNSRLTGNLTPLGSNSSIVTTPSPPLNGAGNVYHPDNYNSFHWPGSSDYIRSYSGAHHQSYGQSAYNSPYYPSQVRYYHF